MTGPTFEEIAAELYAGPLEAFVSSRKARAAEADASLAPRILALRKPSIAAWVVNVFAQERAVQLGEALALARELREAQEDLDAVALAKLGRERRALTRKLAQAAGELASSRGERVTPSTLDAVEQSISAAFYDPGAAAAVASGRLSRALEPSATPDDIRDAVSGDVPELPPVSAPPADELQARRARRDAEHAVAAAEKDHTSAERELTRREEAVSELRARRDGLSEHVSDLETQLAQARADLVKVEREIPEAEQGHSEAAARAEAAADALDRARKAKDAL
ncbi:transposase [Microbacterium maritypicum]|uniref:transposase n=1 Tax=Microbacterium maritypicum TaxID=33918 RepID=UPI00382A6D8A